MTVRGALALTVLLAAAAACRGTGTGDEVLVSAAASLTDAVREVAIAFEDANPGAHVVLNLAGSQALRDQVLAGAPVDVLATADTETMEAVVAAGATASDPVPFATNHLQLAVPAGNPGGVTGIADLARDELLVGLCAPQVPCGRLARAALDAAGVTAVPDTEEPDVRALLTRLAEGELDVAITYATDVAASDGAVEGIDLEPEHDQRASLPVAVLADAPDPAVAEAFVAFLLGDEGRRILRDHGFGTP